MELYPHLLHAGALPTYQEHASILAAKLSYEDQRTKLAQEIRELQKRLEEAQKQLELLDQKIDTHSRLISPLRRIPPEILRDIFALATPSPVGIEPVADRILHAPWTTMEVCRHWNEVCLMFGSLWSHITIKCGPFRERPAPALPDGGIPPEYWPGNDTVTYSPLETKQTARSAELLTTQLRRSKDANLYITIGRGVIGPSTVSEDYCQPYLRILLPHIHRALYIKAPSYILVDTPLPCPLDRLWEVHVDYFGFPFSGEHGHSHMMHNTMHSGATHFSATIFHGLTDGLGGEQLPTNIYSPHTLTRLVVTTYNGWAQLRPLLHQLRNLTDLQLTEGRRFPNHDQQPNPPDLDPIPLGKLSTLSINCLDLPQPAEILTHIVAPNLRHLSCRAPESIHPIEQFFTASGCKLQTLRIQYEIYESLLNFITSCADAISDIHALEITQASDLYAGHPNREELILEDANAVCLIELLSRGGGDSGVDSADAPLPGIKLVFPQLQILQLQSMKLPVREFINMLQTRRHPQLSVQLASCSIANVQSIHHSLSIEEAKMEAAKRMRERDIQQDGFIRRDDRSSSEWPGWRVQRKPEIVYSHNRQLTWAEGLEREPEQKQRLEKLVDRGLEMWM